MRYESNTDAPSLLTIDIKAPWSIVSVPEQRVIVSYNLPTVSFFICDANKLMTGELWSTNDGDYASSTPFLAPLSRLDLSLTG
jgi:hypothetical protein